MWDLPLDLPLRLRLHLPLHLPFLKSEIAFALAFAVAVAVAEMNSSHKCTEQVFQPPAPAFGAAEPQKHGSSPRIYSGEERFSAPEKRHLMSRRFSAGLLIVVLS